MQRNDNIFSSVAMADVGSNQFDLSHERKLTFNMGKIVPAIRPLEVIPGDSFQFKFTNLLRFLPLVAPVMHRVRVKTEMFFVPNRLVWDGWEDFITGVDPAASPYILLNDEIPVGCLADYLGIPPGDYSVAELRISAIPIAGYFKAYDDWYRDQNLITEKFIPLVPGDNSTAYLPLLLADPLNCAWEHDYFTSCLPFAQQGNTEVDIPLTFQNDIPVEFTFPSGGALMKNATTGAVITAGGLAASAPDGVLLTGVTASAIDPNGSLTVDIQSDAATINDLREAFSLQAFLERSIRGGLRYIEQIFSHFKVKSSDARLQRVEMIGRASQNMTIGEVLATAQSSNDGSTAEIGLGTMGGHGISVGEGIMSYRAEEHGWIFAMIRVLPDTAYQDGIDRSLFRLDRLDYYWPSFANLGEQAVLTKELLAAVPLGVNPDAVFGYIPRYSEMRYIPSSVAGQFRTTLAYWTLARILNAPGTVPLLNEEFIECVPRNDIFAVTDPDVHHVIAQIILNYNAVRKLPRYAVPSTLR